jgi:hypothetical protein
MRLFPRGHGGKRRPPDEIKRDGWQTQGILVVSETDARLSWPERELVRQLGTRLYGERAKEACCG